jgi:hypothetical protein
LLLLLLLLILQLLLRCLSPQQPFAVKVLNLHIFATMTSKCKYLQVLDWNGRDFVIEFLDSKLHGNAAARFLKLVCHKEEAYGCVLRACVTFLSGPAVRCFCPVSVAVSVSTFASICLSRCRFHTRVRTRVLAVVFFPALPLLPTNHCVWQALWHQVLPQRPRARADVFSPPCVRRVQRPAGGGRPAHELQGMPL